MRRNVAFCSSVKYFWKNSRTTPLASRASSHSSLR